MCLLFITVYLISSYFIFSQSKPMYEEFLSLKGIEKKLERSSVNPITVAFDQENME